MEGVNPAFLIISTLFNSRASAPFIVNSWARIDRRAIVIIWKSVVGLQ